MAKSNYPVKFNSFKPFRYRAFQPIGFLVGLFKKRTDTDNRTVYFRKRDIVYFTRRIHAYFLIFQTVPISSLVYHIA